MTGIIRNPSHRPPYTPDCFQSFALGIVVGLCALGLFCAMYDCGAGLVRDKRWDSRRATRRGSMVDDNEEDGSVGTHTPSESSFQWPSTRETSPEVSPEGLPVSIMEPMGWSPRRLSGGGDGRCERNRGLVGVDVCGKDISSFGR
jgi:hypothetical protein